MFEGVSKIAGWSDEEKVQNLIVHLKGSALESVFSKFPGMSTGERPEFEEVADLLVQRFCPAGVRERIGMELQVRTQRKNEDLTTYLEELRKLARKAYPKKENEGMIYDLFVQGISSDKLSEMVQGNCHREEGADIALAKANKWTLANERKATGLRIQDSATGKRISAVTADADHVWVYDEHYGLEKGKGVVEPAPSAANAQHSIASVDTHMGPGSHVELGTMELLRQMQHSQRMMQESQHAQVATTKTIQGNLERVRKTLDSGSQLAQAARPSQYSDSPSGGSLRVDGGPVQRADRPHSQDSRALSSGGQPPFSAGRPQDISGRAQDTSGANSRGWERNRESQRYGGYRPYNDRPNDRPGSRGAEYGGSGVPVMPYYWKDRPYGYKPTPYLRPEKYRGRPDFDPETGVIVCWECGDKGHSSYTCPKIQDGEPATLAQQVTDGSRSSSSLNH
jgi:hypothetical protein